MVVRFSLQKIVTSTIYMNMLEGFTFPHIEYLKHPQCKPILFFNRTALPPHWAFAVRVVLNEKIPGHWIGRVGPTAWSPQSPDITPHDFSLLWEFVKHVVYNTNVANLQDLHSRITACMSTGGRKYAELNMARTCVPP